MKSSKIFQESKNLKREEFYFLAILYWKIFETFQQYAKSRVKSDATKSSELHSPWHQCRRGGRSEYQELRGSYSPSRPDIFLFVEKGARPRF